MIYTCIRYSRKLCIYTQSFLYSNICNLPFTLLLLLLLLEAGDVESNPGPDDGIHDLSILHLNIRSIRNKMEYIKDNFLDYNILCFSETHLDVNVPTEELSLLPNFSEPYRKDRNSHGGGVMIYLNSDLFHVRRPDLEVFWHESLWVEIKVNHINYLIGLFYSPRPFDRSFFDCLSLNIECALDTSRNIILLGDMNEDLLNLNYHNLKDVLIVNSMQNTVLEATRLGAILDPIIIPEDMSYLKSGTLGVPPSISDHKATFINIPFSYECHSTYERLIWIYKNADFSLLKQKVSSFDWNSLLTGTLDEACNLFTKTFLNFIKECIPSKYVLIRPNDKPWYDSEIRHFSRTRDRLKSKFIRSNNPNDWTKYKQVRNKVNNLKKHAKEKFYNDLELTITDSFDNDKRKFWKLIRNFVKSDCNSSSIPPLKEINLDGSITHCFTDFEKAECLNNYFVSISTVNDDNVHLPPQRKRCNNSLSNIRCTAAEIEILIKLLNPNKATGPDTISNRMLKAVAKEIAVPLEILFNRSFTECKFPQFWKVSYVIPLPKKGDNSCPSNFRPVSLLSGVGKLQERIVFKNIHNFLNQNNLLYKYQSGFLPNHSTSLQLIDIYHHICQTFDNNQYSCMVFCDVSKAFDRVWHRGLIFKLNEYGITGDLLKWLSDYLENREQKVLIKSCSSNTKPVTAGVPQGSVLGPLLFLIYVNDISESMLSLTRLFADDSSLFYSASSIADIEGIINYDLQILSRWAEQWLIKFNPSKTEAMLFTLKHDTVLPNLIFENTLIQFVDTHKHLGLTFSNNGQWHCHIDNIAKSAAKIIGIMRKLKYTLSRSALNQIYQSYVLPILEYSSIVWDGCSEYDSNTLEKIQNEAARIVTGLTRSVSLDKLYSECCWTPLSNRRKQHKLTFMFKATNGMVPSYITELIPPPVRDTTNYPLRNRNNIVTPYTRTEIFRRSCIPSSVSLWNTLDESVRIADTVNSFKNKTKSIFSNSQVVPPHYIKGDRKLSILHARIRNNCSNLKYDLYQNFLEPNPVCECGSEAEDARHYFFVCQFYRDARQELFRSTRAYHPLSLNKLLLGDIRLNVEANSHIFEAVQRFIKDSKRF